ncbi:MAG: response regulator transcription factor [Dinghuibacter sp.]|nr:response regulator transcription factor [Dinghuibacter sp.]
MMNENILVGIVDDNAALCLQIKENITSAGNIEVCFMAQNGQDAVQKLAALEKLPQVILMDIEMPVMNGIEATAIITRETGIKILILTVFDNDEKVFEAIKAGAAGYLLKDSKAYRIVTAIEDVLMGGAPMSPQIAAKTLELLRTKTGSETQKQPSDYDLSDRETEILKQLVNGLSYQQIAHTLFISHGTVRKHVENIYGKLHIHSKVEAVNKANKYKWFS